MPPIFSVTHVVLTWVDDIVWVYLVLCEDFVVFIIYLIGVFFFLMLVAERKRSLKLVA